MTQANTREGGLLRRVREKLGVTQEQLAKHLGVAFSTVNRWEQEHTRASRQYLVSLMELLLDATENLATTDQVPPHDRAAEEALLALLMIDSEAMHKVLPVIRPEDFYFEQHRHIYEACLALWERNETIDRVSVAHEATRRGDFVSMDAAALLSRLTSEEARTADAESLARIVRSDAVYRSLIAASHEVRTMAYGGGPDLDSVLTRAEDAILSLRPWEDTLRDFTSVRVHLEDYVQTPPDDGVVEAPLAVRTGFVDLDTLLGGLRRGTFVVVAARPSLGKTSLALNIARNAAIGQGARVAIFSLEMAADQLAQRLLAGESGVDATRLRVGEHTEAEEQRIMHAMGVLAEAEVYIDDTAVHRVADIRAKAHRLHRERSLDLIVVDYLQLIQGSAGRGDSRVAEVSEISRALKGLARELDVAVVACSQLSRAPEQRVPHVPMLSDLREMGSIEQDADVVVFIYREDLYLSEEEWQLRNPTKPYPQGIAQLIIAKHRNGPTGNIHLRFRESLTRFEDMPSLPEPEYV